MTSFERRWWLALSYLALGALLAVTPGLGKVGLGAAIICGIASMFWAWTATSISRKPQDRED